MPDGTGHQTTGAPGEQSPTADQQIDNRVDEVGARPDEGVVGSWFNAEQNTSGGGGEGGHFAISSLAELDALIKRWQDIVDRIDTCGRKFDEAIGHVLPPAQDGPSKVEAEKTVASLNAALDHNAAMRDYAQAYIDKLTATRSDYENTESANTSTVDSSGA